jgi:sulfide:quinone oxidoreductase
MKIQTLSATLSVSDQITEAHLPAIAQAGFRAVICNRPDDEGPDQPGHQALAAAAHAQGLKLAYLPVASGRVTAQDGQVFGQLLDELPGPVLAYCRSGMRSTTLWALSQAGRMPWPAVVEQAARSGFNLTGLAAPVV